MVNWKRLYNEPESNPSYNLIAQQQPSKRCFPVMGELFFAF